MMASAAVAITHAYMRAWRESSAHRLVYLGAGAGTRTAGVVMRARIFRSAGRRPVGRRTVPCLCAAKAAAKQYLPS